MRSPVRHLATPLVGAVALGLGAGVSAILCGAALLQPDPNVWVGVANGAVSGLLAAAAASFVFGSRKPRAGDSEPGGHADDLSNPDMARMVSLGRLATSVGHEINNPLTYVIHNLDFATERLQTGPVDPRELRGVLEQAREGAARIDRIVKELRRTARPQKTEFVSVDPRIVIEGAAKLVANQIEQRARLVLDLDQSVAVSSDGGRLGQVFVNLLANAAQAILPGDPEHNEVGVRVAPQGVDEVRIEVWDTGVGIEPEDLHLVFDPSFTTKSTAVGTGLGLAICQRILSDLGGRISVDSKVNIGTRFEVILPRATVEGQPSAADSHVTMRSSRGRILLIDDDPEVLIALARGLESLHAVETHGRARAALEKIAAGERYDVILCDLMMPEMNGAAFYEELRHYYPDQARRVVFMTGGAFEKDLAAFLASVAAPQLEKPCDLKTLREVIARQVEAA